MVAVIFSYAKCFGDLREGRLGWHKLSFVRVYLVLAVLSFDLLSHVRFLLPLSCLSLYLSVSVCICLSA